MQFENVSIVNVSHVDAPHRITTMELEEQLSPTLSRLGFKPNLLGRLSGIFARRFWDEGVRPSEAATMAAEVAIEKADIDPQRIGVLISTSVSKDFLEPSTACFVHANLNLSPHCMNFDIGNACLAFVNGIQIAGNMIERGQIDYALIVDGEASRFAYEQTIERLLDPSADKQIFMDNLATLTLGSGAAAMILARADLAPDGHRVVGGVALAATQYNTLCVGQYNYMKTDAVGLMTSGVKLADQTYSIFLDTMSYHPDDFGHFIMHQVSRPHTNAVIRQLELESDKVHRIYPEFGNIGPAGIPIVLAKALEEGHIQSGQRVVLMGIGSGLNCSMMAIDW